METEVVFARYLGDVNEAASASEGKVQSLVEHCFARVLGQLEQIETATQRRNKE